MTNSGHRDASGGGAKIRADVVECHVVRGDGSSAEMLQLCRARSPLMGTWQPVLGHCEAGEGSVACVVRELGEEIGLEVRDAAVCDGLFAIEQVRPFYVWEIDSVVLGPRFVAIVRHDFQPALNAEHAECRWVPLRDACDQAHWAGQRDTIAEIERTILDAASLAREALRVRF